MAASAIIRTMFGLLCLCLPASAQMLSDGPLRQGPAPEAAAIHVEQYRDWLHVCAGGVEEPQSCELRPTVVESEGPRTLVVAIVRPPDSERAVLVLRTPLDMLLSEGLSLAIDGAPAGRLAYQTCDAAGCVAPARVEGQLDAGLRRGLKLEVQTLSRTGEATTTTVSLLGLTAGLASLAAD